MTQGIYLSATPDIHRDVFRPRGWPACHGQPGATALVRNTLPIARAVALLRFTDAEE